jgi:hypothetical protein
LESLFRFDCEKAFCLVAIIIVQFITSLNTVTTIESRNAQYFLNHPAIRIGDKGGVKATLFPMTQVMRYSSIHIRVRQHAQICVKSHARRHFDPYFDPLNCIGVESRFKMVARVLQSKFHMLPDAYAQ